MALVKCRCSRISIVCDIQKTCKDNPNSFLCVHFNNIIIGNEYSQGKGNSGERNGKDQNDDTGRNLFSTATTPEVVRPVFRLPESIYNQFRLRCGTRDFNISSE